MLRLFFHEKTQTFKIVSEEMPSSVSKLGFEVKRFDSVGYLMGIAVGLAAAQKYEGSAYIKYDAGELREAIIRAEVNPSTTMLSVYDSNEEAIAHGLSHGAVYIAGFAHEETEGSIVKIPDANN